MVQVVFRTKRSHGSHAFSDSAERRQSLWSGKPKRPLGVSILSQCRHSMHLRNAEGTGSPGTYVFLNLILDSFYSPTREDDDLDVAIEEYEYRGFPITVYQNAHTVGSDVPTYFATVTNLQTKSKNASVVAGDSEIVEVVKDAAQNHVDKLVSRRKH